MFEPGEPGSGYSFKSKVIGGSIPEEFIPGVEKGLEASRETGVLAGFPVIDFKATLVDGNYHDVASSVLAFELAARHAEVVRALVPLANMFGYANSLRMMAQGRGAHYMVFDHYAPVSEGPDDGSFRPVAGMRA